MPPSSFETMYKCRMNYAKMKDEGNQQKRNFSAMIEV